MQLLKQREEQHNDLNMKRLDRLWWVVVMQARETVALGVWVVLVFDGKVKDSGSDIICMCVMQAA